MKKFLLLGLIIITSLFLSKTTFATSVSGVTMNGSSGKVVILNNSKNDSSGDFSLSVSLDFDPDSTGSTQFKLPQGADDQIVIKLLGSTGKSLVSSKVVGVANLKPTSAPIFSAIYPKNEFLKAFPDPSSPENNAFVQIEDFTNKKIYYKSEVFQVFQYNKPNDVKNKTADNTKYYFTWQEVAGGYKIEREIIGKDACEAERTSGEYKITTPCATTSSQASIDAFNKTLGDYPFKWQMDNYITKETRKGGGDTVVACNLNRSGKIMDLTPAQLANWKNTKLCSDLSGAANPYYFNWLDDTTKLKYEMSFVNKTDCEKEQVNKKYTNATNCYSPSQQSTISDYNKAQLVDPGKEPNEFNTTYNLLAPIGNLESIGGESDNKIGDYLNVVLMIAIGLCGALAVIMIVIRGVQYMGDESVFGKTEAKHHIMQAVLGLILALGAYAILNTINPKLVGGTLSFNQVNIELTSGNEYRLASTQASDQKFKRTSYYDQVKKYVEAADYSKFYSKKINHCMAQVAIQRETHGDPNLIGHDEDAPVQGVPSRKRFVESGKKKSGASLSGSITDRSLFNDDHEGSAIHTFPNKNGGNYDLGLDWRFSHGIGLMQVTFYPAGSNDGPNYNLGMKTLVTQTPMKMKDLLVPENAIKAGVEHLQYNFKYCNGDVEKTYRAYGGGRCDSGGFMNTEAPLRKNLYDQCVAQDK